MVGMAGMAGIDQLDASELLLDEATDHHHLAAEESILLERTIVMEATDDETEIMTTEDGREVLPIVSESQGIETSDEMTERDETAVTNAMSVPTATTEKVWSKQNSTHKYKGSKADTRSANDSPAPAHDELDTAE